jgi:hypothetical protein
VSKAFTREDADSGFQAPLPSARHSEGRLTAYGARLVRERLADLERSGGPVERLRECVALSRARWDRALLR